MTREPLERRVDDLEQQVAELKPLRPLGSVQETFCMFAGDSELEELVRLGRQYRNQINSGNE